MNRNPLLAAGLLLGAGLGGFLDGILLHQVLQWHNMISAQNPPVDLASAKVNMFWDGIFHLGVWLVTLLGLRLLWVAARRPDVPWVGRILVGAMLLGWGAFNVVEGGVDHLILELHHVYEAARNPLQADLAFLAFGVALIVVGMLLVGKPVAEAQSGHLLR